MANGRQQIFNLILSLRKLEWNAETVGMFQCSSVLPTRVDFKCEPFILHLIPQRPAVWTLKRPDWTLKRHAGKVLRGAMGI